jgi:hypothetical protein
MDDDPAEKNLDQMARQLADEWCRAATENDMTLDELWESLCEYMNELNESTTDEAPSVDAT